MNVSRVHRLLRLITMLQSGRSYSAREPADELEVSRRTIFRDLKMLELARIPYYYDVDRGGYRIGRHFFLPPINLTLSEALAMTGRLRGAEDVPLMGQAAMVGGKARERPAGFDTRPRRRGRRLRSARPRCWRARRRKGARP